MMMVSLSDWCRNNLHSIPWISRTFLNYFRLLGDLFLVGFSSVPISSASEVFYSVFKSASATSSTKWITVATVIVLSFQMSWASFWNDCTVLYTICISCVTTFDLHLQGHKLLFWASKLYQFLIPWVP